MNRDNQQGTVRDTELAWLAGFLDSDGSVQITMPQQQKGRVKRVVNVWIDFSNGDASIIEKAADIISRMGISFHTAQKKVRPIYKEGGGKFLPRREICLSIRIGKLTSAKNLLEKVIPYLAGTKAAHSRIIVKYCARRIALGKAPYDGEDFAILREFFEDRGSPASLRNIGYIDGLLNDYEHGAIEAMV